MPLHTLLAPASDWVQLSTTDADWAQADPALLGALLAHMHIIRGFEECVLKLAGEGLVHGPAHSSIGQEGGAAGSIVGLTTAEIGRASCRERVVTYVLITVGAVSLNKNIDILNS